MPLELPWSNDDSYTLPLLLSQPRSSLPEVISPDESFPVFSHATATGILIGHLDLVEYLVSKACSSSKFYSDPLRIKNKNKNNKYVNRPCIARVIS